MAGLVRKMCRIQNIKLKIMMCMFGFDDTYEMIHLVTDIDFVLKNKKTYQTVAYNTYLSVGDDPKICEVCK